jgi:LacI family transcriptional regulator
MANVREIAKNLGVSVATVSRALNDKPNVRPDTRERILAEASRIGYDFVRPATAPKVIGLAYTSYQGHLDYGGFDSALMAGVLRGVEEQRYDINIISIHRDKTPNEDFRTFFRRKGVAGVILRTFQGSRHLCEEIADEGFPAVVVADRFDNPKVNFTCTESRLQSQRAVEHLIHLGHTRIGLGVHRVRDTDHQDRCDGYRDALEKHGLEFDPSLVVDLVADLAGGGNTISFFLSLPDPPTAIYFTDPLATLGALHKCRALGLEAPRDLSILGFDDSNVRRHAFPPFTAVCQDATALGFEAAHWLSRYLAGFQKGQLRHTIPTTLEINETTGPPPESPPRLRNNHH